MISLRRGDSGKAVFDLQQRLALAGYEIEEDYHVFGPSTETALKQFQADRGLIADGICGPYSWNALVEADYQLGDRLLYYRLPMMHGDDIVDLQQKLGKLGFDAGWVDGIFGLDTQTAVQQFQHNIGLPVDGVFGRSTLQALLRITKQPAGEVTVTEVRQHERLRQQPCLVEGRKIVVGNMGEISVIAQSAARFLRQAGAEVLSLGTPNLSHQAYITNKWSGDAYIGLTLISTNCDMSYFSTSGFKSTGGQALANRCSQALQHIFPQPIPITGLSIPILRETRMPAVWCRLGPGAKVVTRAPEIAEALATAVVTWCFQPFKLADNEDEKSRNVDLATI